MISVWLVAPGIDPSLVNSWELGIFPNPGQGKFTVNILGEGNKTIQASVVNLLGQTIAKTEIIMVNGKASAQMDITEFGASVYLLHLADGHSETVTRVVIE